MKFNKGAVIKEPGSTKKTKTGGWRTFRVKILLDKCKKCGICWKSCPDAAIHVDEKGEYHINYDYCKGCLICFKECPFNAIEKELEGK